VAHVFAILAFVALPSKDGKPAGDKKTSGDKKTAEAPKPKVE
jgi:hypothetical protein